MTRKQRRLTMIGGSLAVLALAAALVLNALRDSIVFFSTPIDGGRKAHSSRASGSGSAAWCSRARSCAATISRSASRCPTAARRLPVTYKGILPDLFREGQGVVAEGALDAAGVFKADTVLAKHDETYMPKDVADALKKQGHWKDDYGEEGPGKPGVQAAGKQGASQ